MSIALTSLIRHRLCRELSSCMLFSLVSLFFAKNLFFLLSSFPMVADFPHCPRHSVVVIVSACASIRLPPLLSFVQVFLRLLRVLSCTLFFFSRFFCSSFFFYSLPFSFRGVNTANASSGLPVIEIFPCNLLLAPRLLTR